PGALKALPDLQHARFDASLRHPTWPSTTEGGDILPRMRWVAPPAKDAATATLEKRLWAAADELRANSGLTSAQYAQPVLGLIFLRFAEVRFAAQREKLEKTAASSRRGSRVDVPARIPRGWRPVTSRPPPDSTISATCPKVRMPGKSSTKRWRIS